MTGEIASMSLVKFEHIKGTENILADGISRLRCMGYYVTLDPEEKGKEFEHFAFEELPLIKMEQKGSRVTVNQIKHVPTLLGQEIKRLQQEDSQHSKVMKNMKEKSEWKFQFRSPWSPTEQDER